MLPKYTTRLSIPFPDDRDDEWYDKEDGVGGRMERLDLLLCAAIENSNCIIDHILSTGSLNWNRIDTMTVSGGDVVVRFASGGSITFANGASAVVPDGSWLYFEVPERPVTGSHVGTLQVASAVQPDASKVIIGRAETATFWWLRPALQM